MSKITPDMLKSKLVFDSKGIRAGTITKVIRERYNKFSADFIEIELDRRFNIGPKVKVKVRTRDAQLQTDGNVKVKHSKEQLKVMSKEQELQRHPPTV